MKQCTEPEFNLLVDCFKQRKFDRTGTFSLDQEGRLNLTLRSKTLPVFPHRVGFLKIEGGGEIPLEERLDVIADSISKPEWEVYAIGDSKTGTHYYDYQNLYLQSMIDGEEWQIKETIGRSMRGIIL
jgi:hypothetical protein